MSEELRPISYGVGETHPFPGREIGKAREYSERTTARLITVLAPPAYAPGTIMRTIEVREPPAAAPWRPFP